jgi:8-oxo-dGTP pyrophosphatase MutT (NUDIX family)
MKTQVIQKAVIFNDSGEILMLRRSKTDVRRPGEWDLPGGLYEDGEELFESVNREITEETGLSVTDLLPVYTKTEIRSWKDGKTEHQTNAVFIFYVAKAVSTNVKLSWEHDKLQWKPIEDAVKEFEYYLHKELLEHIIKNQLKLD